MIPSNYFSYARQLESGGNPNARNPLSSAGGLYQFTNGTFLNVMRPFMPGRSDQDILAVKMQPDMQEKAMQTLTQQNAEYLQRNNLPVTNQTLYAAHHFGPAGAKRLLTTDPNAPLSQVFDQQVLSANPYLQNVGNRDALMANWDARASGAPQDASAPASTPAPAPSPDATAPQQEGFNWDGFGNSLISAGAAIASISNPTQAAAILKTLEGRKSKDEDWQTTINQQTGQIIRVNKKNGAVQVVNNAQIAEANRAAAAAEEDAKIRVWEKTQGVAQANKPYDPPKFLLENWDKNDEITSLARGNLESLNRYTEAIANKQLSLSLLQKTENELRALGNKGDAQAAMAAEFKGFLEKLRNDSLRANKGMQTEGDAIRAMEEFIARGASYDDRSALASLSRFATSVADQGMWHSKKNLEYLGRSEKIKNYFDKEGIYSEEYGSRLKLFEEEKKRFVERRNTATTNTPPAQTGPGLPTDPGQRRQQLNRTLFGQ